MLKFGVLYWKQVRELIKMDNTLWPIKEINKCAYNSKSNRIMYTAVWDCPEETETKEPLEYFMSCPLIVLQFEKKQYEDFKSAIKKKPIENAKGMRKMPLTRQSVLKKVVIDEYIPNGNEYLIKIYHRFVTNDGIEIYKVRFARMKVCVRVRLIFLEYYFPAKLLNFWLEKKIKGPVS